MHPVIPLVARVLEQPAVELRHRNRGGPRLRVVHWIVDRDLVVDAVGVHAREALDHPRLLACRSEDQRGAVVGGGDVLHVRRLDHQRIAFPTAAGVAQPLTDAGTYVRTPVQRDDPRIVDHLDIDRDETGRLQDLVVVVVEPGHHGAWYCAGDAPLVQVPALGPVCRTALLGLVSSRFPRQSLLCQGREFPRRVHDERRAIGQVSPLQPEIVVGAGIARFRTLIDAGGCLPVLLGQLLVRENRFVLEVVGSFQTGCGGVRPLPLQVRIAPRGARRSLRFGGLRVRHGWQRGPDSGDGNHHADQNQESNLHFEPPLGGTEPKFPIGARPWRILHPPWSSERNFPVPCVTRHEGRNPQPNCGRQCVVLDISPTLVSDCTLSSPTPGVVNLCSLEALLRTNHGS